MPNRIIKESVCRSESINALSWFEEVLFYRLIVVCDDFGRFDGRPAIIRGACFPLKDIRLEQIADALEKLAAAGMVRMYKAEDGTFLQLTAWSRHQQIRAKKSKYPSPDGTCNQLISDGCNSSRKRESGIEYDREIPLTPLRREEGTGAVRLFGEFCDVYPKARADSPGSMRAYCRALVEDCHITEKDLVAAAANYAEAVRILGREDKYIRNPESFLSDNFFASYLPGQYERPKADAKKGRKNNSFNQFEQNSYDFSALEDELVSN